MKSLILYLFKRVIQKIDDSIFFCTMSFSKKYNKKNKQNIQNLSLKIHHCLKCSFYVK